MVITTPTVHEATLTLRWSMLRPKYVLNLDKLESTAGDDYQTAGKACGYFIFTFISLYLASYAILVIFLR